MKKIAYSLWEILEVVVIAGITVFLIRSFLIQPFVVSGASMEPNLSNKNYLLVDQITGRFRELLRGEVIVFRYPLDPGTFFIKRIIGLPGEHIVSNDGKIIVETSIGERVELAEPYVASENGSRSNFEITLSSEEYFVMGDNRSHSFDSRNWGAIHKSDIVGIARVRIFPLDSFEVFGIPAY